MAHAELEVCLYELGDSVLAREHFEQGITLYDPQQHRSLVLLYGQDLGVYCHGLGASVLWCLGYPAQALKSAREALTLARRLSHPYTLAYDLLHVAMFYQLRREALAVQELAEEAIALATEHGFHLISAWVAIFRGWALAKQGEAAEGIAQMRQSLAAFRATGAGVGLPLYLSLLAEACGKVGQVEEGLTLLAEALATVDKTEERFYEAELYRLKGELLLQQENQKAKVKEQKSKIETDPRSLMPDAQGKTEACFLKAMEIAKKQQAKSLELRTVMSLSRLWQTQGKKAEARRMLAEIYGWFTEGFDTKDLQEAKALLDGLS
ncbi:MAG: tetratricopeptide repeat protein [Deltaproteobacteria bacterium]|nr:tetratricopeptide repeat protein [Deltaproteobacteria bacterium]